MHIKRTRHITNQRGVAQSKRRANRFRKLKEEQLDKETNRMSRIGNYVVGLQEKPTYINCPECEGEGTVEREVWVRQSATWHGDFESKTQDCDNCNGAGRIERDDDA